MAKKKSSSRGSGKKKATRTPARKKTSKKKAATRSASAGRSTSAKRSTKKKSASKKKKASSKKPASRKKVNSKKKAAAGTGNKRISKSAAASAKSSAKSAPKKKSKSKSKAPAKPADDAPAPAAETEAPRRPKLSLAPASSIEPNGSQKSKAQRPVKPPTSAVPVADREPPTESELRKVKTGLTRRDKDKYRRMLLQKRSQILGDVQALQIESRSSGGNLSHMPVHMADIGSDNYEQEFTLGLVESERKLLREIDDALQRLSKGTYGVCVQTGTPIGKARLDAKPWAKYCIEAVRELERLGKL